MDHLSLGQRLDAVVTALRAAGVHAGLTPTEVTAPGIIVSLDTVGPALLAGPPPITAALDLIVPDVGFPTAYTHLGTLITAATDLGADTVAAVINAAGQTIGYRATLPI